MLRHLGSLEEIGRLLEGRRLFVALDYDGTLTPIVERPDLAGVCAVGVISGRDLEDVRGLVGLDGLYYAGSHGFEIAGSAGKSISFRRGEEFLPLLGSAERELRDLLEGIEGVLVERKKFSVAVHYRMTEESRVPELERVFARVLKGHAGLRRGKGKKVLELQPAIDWHKGKALLWLMKALDMDGPDVLPVYIGDDVTDEDAFRALRSRGIGILVEDGSGGRCKDSAARYFLSDCAEVRTLLASLVRIAGR